MIINAYENDFVERVGVKDERRGRGRGFDV